VCNKNFLPAQKDWEQKYVSKICHNMLYKKMLEIVQSGIMDRYRMLKLECARPGIFCVEEPKNAAQIGAIQSHSNSNHI
jgi:hypothetical protein